MVDATPSIPLVLQLRDEVSARECSLRLDPERLPVMPLGALLDRYLKNAPLEQLLAESRITSTSAEALYAIGDLVYASDDGGRLMEMFTGVAFTDAGRPIGLEDVPAAHRVSLPFHSGGKPGWGHSPDREVSIIDITESTGSPASTTETGGASMSAGGCGLRNGTRPSSGIP